MKSTLLSGYPSPILDGKGVPNRTISLLRIESTLMKSSSSDPTARDDVELQRLGIKLSASKKSSSSLCAVLSFSFDS